MSVNYQQKYYAKYNEIKPKLLNFEKNRKKIANKYIWVFSVFFAILFTFFILSFYYIHLYWESIELLILFIFGSFFLFLWICLFFDIKKNKLEPEYKILKESAKETCLKDLLSAFSFIKRKKRPNIKQLQSLLLESNAFSEFYSIWCDDVFEGVYKDTQFGIYESVLNIEEYVKSKFIKSSMSIFKGIILCYQFNKKILSNTIITSKYDYGIKNIPSLWLIIIAIVALLDTIMLGYSSFYCKGADIILVSGIMILFTIFIWLFLIRKFYKATYKFQKIKLEDVLFDKKYNVYSENQVEARYILTPSFMERFINLQTAFGTQKIKCSFLGDKIIFIIPTKRDLFEVVDLFTPLNKTNQIDKLYKEISSTFEMIDYFKLNERIGL